MTVRRAMDPQESKIVPVVDGNMEMEGIFAVAKR